jgi:hypothetical protein
MDLGKRDFYFSSKNCRSKVYTSLVNVVFLVSQSTAKLVWQFLDFYDFIGILQGSAQGVKV